MTPFSELYCKYYTLVTELLNLAQEGPLSLQTLRTLIEEKGFLESTLSLLPSLTAQDEEGYHLFKQEADGYHSLLKNKPVTYTTHIEASWLKTLLQDPKLHLFLDDEDVYQLKKALSHVEPLFSLDMVAFARQNSTFSSIEAKYLEEHFKAITFALKNQKLLILTLSDEIETSIVVAPYKLEYAIREDCFSLLAMKLEGNAPITLERIPLTQITSLNLRDSSPSREVLNAFAKAYKCKEPISFELNNMRSGFERAFMYLSPYERMTEYHEESDTCTVQLYYYPFDEAALIDMLLSFGPIVKLLGPPHIRATFKERIQAQAQLFAHITTR